MARKSLRPHLNQIRAWVRQGRTDAWIAHQLDVTGQEIANFKRLNALEGGEEPGEGTTAAEYPEEIDLRAEDDALIAAELEAVAAAKSEADDEEDADADPSPNGDSTTSPRPRRRGRRGGRGRRASGAAGGDLEGTFDHGEEGYGLWMDASIQDNAVYAEHWAGHRPVLITIEEDRIVIKRVETTDRDDDEATSDDEGSKDA